MKYFLGLLIVAGILWGKPAPIIQQFNVTTVKVKRSDAMLSLPKTFGYLRADEGQENIVALRFGGYVEKLYANETYRYIHKVTSSPRSTARRCCKPRKSISARLNTTRSAPIRGWCRVRRSG